MVGAVLVEAEYIISTFLTHVTCLTSFAGTVREPVPMVQSLKIGKKIVLTFGIYNKTRVSSEP